MASLSSSEYVIYHPEKLRLYDIFCMLVLGRIPVGSEFIESSSQDVKFQSTVGANLIIIITLLLQKLLALIKGPLRFLGCIVEFTLNLFSLNGGILGLIIRTVTGSLVIPKRESANFRSIIGFIDGRMDLYKKPSRTSTLPASMVPLNNTLGEINVLDLCAMAATVSYENEGYVNKVVTNHWKMHFVGLYHFWNEFLEEKATQAFIFTDRKEDARLIVVAFRGTEPFIAADWSSDINLSWLSMGEMGSVHLGFMKALGLQHETDYQKGWPKNYTGQKELAYYTIREKLKELLKKNPDARIIVTGHSLGGALAALFPAILFLHKEATILRSLLGVYTFGQPRVGNKDFGSYMESQLNAVYRRYHRVVYRYDIVPRVPFDDLVFRFAHFGGCIYYKSWYKAEVLKEEPDGNYFNIFYIPSKYFNAWLDLFRGLFVGITHGKDFREGLVSIGFRLLGLLVPGLASHSPRDYINGVRLGKIIIVKEEETIKL